MHLKKKLPFLQNVPLSDAVDGVLSLMLTTRGCSGRTFSGIGSGRVVPEFFSRVSGKRPRVSGTDSGSVSKGILTFLNSVHNIF